MHKKLKKRIYPVIIDRNKPENFPSLHSNIKIIQADLSLFFIGYSFHAQHFPDHLLYFSHPFSFTAIQKNSFLFYCTGGTLVHCKLPGAVSPRPFQHPAWNKHAARILHQIKGGFYYLH